jgi:hypothetical protein
VARPEGGARGRAARLYAGQIRYLAQDRFRIAWPGLYLATGEPVHQYDPRELSTWVSTPTTDTSGFMFNQTAMDPSCSPAGTNLYVMGAVFPGEKGRDQRFLRDTFLAFEEGIKVMWPGFAHPVWRRRHLVFEPSFGVIQKPGLVGMYRPHWRAPNVDGLSCSPVPSPCRSTPGSPPASSATWCATPA